MSCARCHDIGWIEEPCSSEGFEPQLDIVACPDCNRVEGSPRGCLLITLAIIGLVVLFTWGAR